MHHMTSPQTCKVVYDIFESFKNSCDVNGMIIFISNLNIRKTKQDIEEL